MLYFRVEKDRTEESDHDPDGDEVSDYMEEEGSTYSEAPLGGLSSPHVDQSR